jgi:hypothetical protein
MSNAIVHGVAAILGKSTSKNNYNYPTLAKRRLGWGTLVFGG